MSSKENTGSNEKTDSKKKTEKETTAKGPRSPMSSFGQVVPMCSDDEWLAAEAAKPSSQLNLAKTKGKVTVFATPSSQRQMKRKALNQSHASILGKLVANLVGQLLESKEGTEVEIHVKIGGHTHNLIKKTYPDAPLPKCGTNTPLPSTPVKSSKSTTASRETA
ncbi:hypothetical protein PRIPAC_72391 [Pristionchus pacificus]|uniref:Uncharacterized protein n=1 Tax=Pristionchus pacificus TaxID=54126 RepID=A0A454XXK8_PRIPA|nr:hypothetical protein PRIPAC_72391 [Pristionchus pacificus]|eukprot:PDM83783.1 hypothetical protein PRIPAC_30270 [Pristionchus pacificus]